MWGWLTGGGGGGEPAAPTPQGQQVRRVWSWGAARQWRGATPRSPRDGGRGQALRPARRRRCRQPPPPLRCAAKATCAPPAARRPRRRCSSTWPPARAASGRRWPPTRRWSCSTRTRTATARRPSGTSRLTARRCGGQQLAAAPDAALQLAVAGRRLCQTGSSAAACLRRPGAHCLLSQSAAGADRHAGGRPVQL